MKFLKIAFIVVFCFAIFALPALVALFLEIQKAYRTILQTLWPVHSHKVR
jgi:hypothetical protein